MGAWIETEWRLKGHAEHSSHPAWVRGLKPVESVKYDSVYLVAPCVGAWIETELKKQYRELVKSHPAWVRGLKLGK